MLSSIQFYRLIFKCYIVLQKVAKFNVLLGIKVQVAKIDEIKYSIITIISKLYFSHPHLKKQKNIAHEKNYLGKKYSH